MIRQESCYLEVAKIKKENEMLDAHWKDCAKNKQWVSIDGEVTSFSELDDIHLTNVIAMLTRFYQERQSKALRSLVHGLTEELLSRVKED